MKDKLRWAVVAGLLVGGITGSWALGEALRRDAERSWRVEAEQIAGWLSDTIQGWLNESCVPLAGLAILFESSKDVTEAEFLAGADALEARTQAFFLDTMGAARPGPEGEWELLFSNDPFGLLAPEAPLAETAEVLSALQLAAQRPGQTTLGPSFTSPDGTRFSAVALVIRDRSGPVAIVGLLNWDALTESLFLLHEPRGARCSITGRFTDEEGLGSEQMIVGSTLAEARHSVATRTISAGADITITWTMSSDFQGGPQTALARLAFLSGATTSLLVTALITFLLLRNRSITRRVEEATMELVGAREAALAANRAKSTFLANMSHELRTPLNAVIGYSEMLEEETVELGQESMTSDLRKIHEAGKHLLSLIDDILDLSKVEAGKLDVTIEPVDLDRLLDEITELAHPLIEERANRLVLDCPEPLGTLESDTRKIRQTLLNLIGNAAKFTEAGTITLGGRRFDDAGRLEITVTDTGIGMTQEQLDRLFQAFTQADQAISVKYGGTGLGLALSRRLARMLGGDLMASSEYGVGSTFTLRLPLDRAELPETPAGDA